VTESKTTTNADQESSKAKAKALKRFPTNSIKLMFAGELVMAKNPNRELSGLFRRYEAIFEHFANMPKEERIINYKLFAGLILTSHAKKATSVEDKKKLFDYKNDLFVTLANDREARRKLNFMYLMSKNFRVIKFCADCEKRNTNEKLERHQWKFCKGCELDRNFYNVLSMHHKFKDGSSTLYLSNDLIERVKGLNIKKKGKLEDMQEEAQFQKYHYNVRNLDAFELQSVIQWYKRLGGSVS
jgi:predicted DNA binding CopG/RHH family protein